MRKRAAGRRIVGHIQNVERFEALANGLNGVGSGNQLADLVAEA
jgi:hypothetical protein